MTTLLSDISYSGLHCVDVAMKALNAHDGLDLFLLIADGLIWLRVAWRLAFPAIAAGEVVQRGANVLRAVLIASSLVLTYRIFSGHYITPFEPAEFASNFFVWILIEAYRGNVGPLYDVLRAAWMRTRVAKWSVWSRLGALFNRVARLRIFGGKRDGA